MKDIAAQHVNITRIRTFKGLEANMVFIADRNRIEPYNTKTSLIIDDIK